MPSTTYVPPDHDPHKSMQEWMAWDAAAELAEKNQRTAAKQRRSETDRNWVASWVTATLTVVAMVLPLISILFAVAISH